MYNYYVALEYSLLNYTKYLAKINSEERICAGVKPANHWNL